MVIVLNSKGKPLVFCYNNHKKINKESILENIGNWTLKIVVHHSGESPIGDKYDFKSSIEIPLSAKTRKMAIAEAEKIIDEMDVEKLKAIYEPEIDDEDAITINEFQIAFSQKVNRPMKSIQQWF